jgi:transposase
MVIALIVSPEGLPLSYEVFSGNRLDVTTLKKILEAVEKKYGQAQRVWVFDRGIVSEENLVCCASAARIIWWARPGAN